MIDEDRVIHICIALDCRRTGKPRFAGRDFICTKCLGCCDDILLNKHTVVAAKMLAAQRTAAAKPNFRNNSARDRAEFVELRSWGDLRRQVIEKCGVKPATVEG